MANDVSAFGFTLNMIASVTFPFGIDLTAFADDSDPFDIPALTIKDTAMGVNGDLITWSKANPIKTSVSVIEGSDDDLNLSVVLEANRVGKGKLAINDTITLTAVYPTGKTISLTNGVMTMGMPGPSVSSAGRLKTKVFNFAFENRVGTP